MLGVLLGQDELTRDSGYDMYPRLESFGKYSDGRTRRPLTVSRLTRSCRTVVGSHRFGK